jgi:hypothetical protein
MFNKHRSFVLYLRLVSASTAFKSIYRSSSLKIHFSFKQNHIYSHDTCRGRLGKEKNISRNNQQERGWKEERKKSKNKAKMKDKIRYYRELQI